MDSEYRFKIEGSYTPATLPMQRLAAYAAALARLLGEAANVHFGGVEAGSAVLVARIDEPSTAKVRERTLRVQRGDATDDAHKAFADLDDLLREDNATGVLASPADHIVIPFPGRTRPDRLVFGPFKQDGTLDGQVIRVGGRDETVPVHLRDGAVIHSHLNATPDMARKIAQHLFGPTIRVHGTGTWYRSGDGAWELRNFRIADFEVLDETPLREVVHALREAEGSRWNDVPDPVRELLHERHDEGEAH